MLVKFQATVVALGMLMMFPISGNAVAIDVSNPPLGGSCGLDIALVMDTSTSIDNTELGQMRTALKGFVDALLPGTPTMFSLVSFDWDDDGAGSDEAATTQLGFSSDASVVKSAIDSTDGSGATNWEAGLLEAASTFDPRAGKQNVIIFASDGNPTVNNGSNATTATTDGNDLSNAVAVADSIKTGAATDGSPTRIITIGIGNGVSQSRLEAISSADAYFGTDFDTLEATLAAVATELCGGTLNVQKVIDADGNLETTEDRTSGGAGWSFTVNASEYQTDVTGAFSVDTNAGSYTVTEVVSSGYNLLSASCTNQSEQAQGTFATPAVSGIQVDDEEIVTCTFINAEQEVPTGTLVVHKTLVNNDGGSASESSFSFKVNGGPSIFFEADGANSLTLPVGTYSVVEDAASGYSASYQNCSNIELSQGETKHCTITNDDILNPEGSGTVHFDKVVCESEEYLPNWGFGADVAIGPNTASDYVNAVNNQNEAEVCWLSDWQFQYAVAPVENPGDNVTEAGSPWTTVGMTAVIGNPAGNTYWFREVLPSGWFPFSGDVTEPRDQDVSAEFYCNTDVLNYDNLEFINDVDAGETFYCVGFNVPPVELPECSDEVDNADDEDELADANDPGCWSIPGDSESYDPNDDSEEDYPQCSDGVDNGDGEDSVGDSEDPGCHTDGNPGNSESYDPNDDDESDGGSSQEDVCPNIAGVQSSMPDGYSLDSEGECEKPSGGGGGGGRRRGGNGGEVLGVATTCGPLLTQYLHKDWKNDSAEVTKLQNFLNQFIAAGLPVNGVFGMDVFEAVKKFQVQYGSDVLIPWVGFPASGISAENTPTGFVYQTTKWKINNLWCPGSEAFPATLI